MDHYCYVPKKRPPEYLKEGRVFFTCEAKEAFLPQVIEALGEDQMMASADIPHGEARERSDLSERVKPRMLGENIARFDNLS